MDDLAPRLLAATLQDFPGHVPGSRPAHARGIGAQGSFQPSAVAAGYCRAEHFAGPVPVTVRFSNSTGLSSVPDAKRDVRGMAVKFHLADGAETDLISITVPVFPARTAEEFLGFMDAAVPQPVRRVSPLQRLLDLLAIRQPPRPDPGETTGVDLGVYRFAATHPVAEAAALAMSMAVTPTSYARAAYHALHAFRVTGCDGTVRAVRFHWEPVAGVRPVTEGDWPLADDYLRRELGSRLADGPAEFVLRMQVAEAGDDTADPSVAWPWRRSLVVMGKLTLTALVEDQIAGCERLSFNPTRLVDGIECSDDQILAARRDVYELSAEQRGAVRCPLMVHPTYP